MSIQPLENSEDEFDSEASLREVYLFSLNSQGNIYTLSTLRLNESQKLLIGTLNRKMYCLEFDRHHIESDGEGPNPEVKDLQFTYIPSGAEILSIDAFKRSGHSHDFVIGITIIKLQSNDSTGSAGVAESGSGGGGQYLNIYSDWEQPQGSGNYSTGFFLENLSQSCLSIELEFIPYQLTHCEIPLRRTYGASNVETVWVLLGSDQRAHIYIEDRLSHSYVDAKDEEILQAIFPELDKACPSVPIWIDFYHLHETRRRLTAIGCEDGELLLWLVDLNYTPAKITFSYQAEFEGSISQVKFYRQYEDQLRPPNGLEKLDDFSSEVSGINLLAVSSISPSVVYENVLEQGLSSFRILARSDDYDVTTCATVADIDFDGEKEILLGTYGQEILAYKLVEKMEEVKKTTQPVSEERKEEEEVEAETNDDVAEIEKPAEEPEMKLVLKWELIWTRGFNAPILSVNSLDLTGDGVEEIAIATTRGLQVLQHDVKKVQQLLFDRFKNYLGTKSNEEK